MDFRQPYEQNSFLGFLDNFLPDWNHEDESVTLNRKYKYISSVEKLGRSEKLDLSVYEIEHSGENDPRVSLSREAFAFLRDYAVRRALVVFKNSKSDNYRLSLITFSSTWETGKKIKTELSNPRRYSFFLGPDAKTNTPYQFLIKQGKAGDFEDLQRRFSIEVVNKEFYKEISKAFTKLINGELKLPSVEDKSQISLEFAVRLIGRIIFCWFLREKKSDAGLSLMPNELLSLESTEKYKGYYHTVLEPIFFEVLNKPVKLRRDDFSKEPFSEIPYLNGGLFSPQDDDFYKRTNGDLQSQFYNTLVIPDSWFKEFFETLEKYNFTIDENTSFDEELSIDPEMLGRIFENLLAEINPETGESARKSTGSYYTPRVIVSYMIDESLLLYLKEHTKIDEKKLRAVISYDLNDDTEYPLGAEEREKITASLEKIKILDPACGSGAFPIGALQKIVFILQQVDPDGHLWFKKQIENTPPEIKRLLEREFLHKNLDYIRKLGIIRENIYGIDIQPIATEISRLRCFLTLVVDERIQDSAENRGIEPLPNLDFKFVTANSLIGLPTSSAVNQMGLFEDDQGIKELKELRDSFFNATGVEREQLKLQFVQSQNRMFQRMIQEGRKGYADLTTKLSSWDPFTHKASMWFDPEWMFGIRDGFNIIIGNPPYVNIEKISKHEKEYFLKEYGEHGSLGKRYDLYQIFILRFIQGLKSENSTLSFILPNTFLVGHSYKLLRKMIVSTCSILQIVDLPKNVFESATVDNVLLFVGKPTRENNIIKIKKLKSNNTVSSVGYQSWDEQFSIHQDKLSLEDNYRINVHTNPQKKAIYERCFSNCELLGDITESSQGIIYI